LKEAAEWSKSLEPVLQLCDCSTLGLVAEVHIKRNKPLQALRAIVVGLSHDPYNPEINVSLLKFVLKLKAKKFNALQDTVLSSIRNVLSNVANLEYSTSGIAKFVCGYVDYCLSRKSFPHLIAATKCELLLDRKADPRSVKSFEQNLQGLEGFNESSASSFLKFLSCHYPDEQSALIMKEKITCVIKL